MKESAGQIFLQQIYQSFIKQQQLIIKSAMFSRNYLGQYHRTKSIKELSSKHKNSYKLMSQQNSILMKNQNMPPFKQPTQQNAHNKKLATPLKTSILKTKANLNIRSSEKNIKSVSSFVMANESFMHCRKSLANDQTTCTSNNKSNKNGRNAHLIALNRKKCSTHISCQNRSIFVEEKELSKKLSIDHGANKYSTVIQTKPSTCYNSVANQNNVQKSASISELNSLNKANIPDEKKSLESIYERMKNILQENSMRERQHERQKQFYITKIKQLQKQLQEFQSAAIQHNCKPSKIKKRNVNGSNLH